MLAGWNSDSIWLGESAPALDSIFLTPIAAESATLPLVEPWRSKQELAAYTNHAVSANSTTTRMVNEHLGPRCTSMPLPTWKA